MNIVMGKKWPGKFRGMKPGSIIEVCEGDGSPDKPYILVYNVYRGGEYLGYIDPYTDAQKEGKDGYVKDIAAAS